MRTSLAVYYSEVDRMLLLMAGLSLVLSKTN